MFTDYCWSLIRDRPTGESKRQRKTDVLINYLLVRILYIDRLIIVIYCLL
jgi:hypothetical protein